MILGIYQYAPNNLGLDSQFLCLKGSNPNKLIVRLRKNKIGKLQIDPFRSITEYKELTLHLRNNFKLAFIYE